MHTVVTTEPYASDCTTEVAKQTAFVAQTASMVMTTIKTVVFVASMQQNPSAVVVVVVPPVATIRLLHHSMVFSLHIVHVHCSVLV